MAAMTICVALSANSGQPDMHHQPCHARTSRQILKLQNWFQNVHVKSVKPVNNFPFPPEILWTSVTRRAKPNRSSGDSRQRLDTACHTACWFHTDFTGKQQLQTNIVNW
jgi:hypothetical protein